MFPGLGTAGRPPPDRGGLALGPLRGSVSRVPRMLVRVSDQCTVAAAALFSERRVCLVCFNFNWVTQWPKPRRMRGMLHGECPGEKRGEAFEVGMEVPTALAVTLSGPWKHLAVAHHRSSLLPAVCWATAIRACARSVLPGKPLQLGSPRCLVFGFRCMVCAVSCILTLANTASPIAHRTRRTPHTPSPAI